MNKPIIVLNNLFLTWGEYKQFIDFKENEKLSLSLGQSLYSVQNVITASFYNLFQSTYLDFKYLKGIGIKITDRYLSCSQEISLKNLSQKYRFKFLYIHLNFLSKITLTEGVFFESLVQKKENFVLSQVNEILVCLQTLAEAHFIQKIFYAALSFALIRENIQKDDFCVILKCLFDYALINPSFIEFESLRIAILGLIIMIRTLQYEELNLFYLSIHNKLLWDKNSVIDFESFYRWIIHSDDFYIKYYIKPGFTGILQETKKNRHLYICEFFGNFCTAVFNRYCL